MMYVGSGVTSSGLVVDSRGLYVHHGGIIKNTTVLDGFVDLQGSAFDTVVSGGEFSIDGYASNTIITGDGYVEVDEPNSVAYDIVVTNGGELEIDDGGKVFGLTISNGANVWIGAQGSAKDVDWTPGEAMFVYQRGNDVSFTRTYSGVYLGRGGKLTSQAASMSNINLSGSGDMLCVLNGGTIRNVNAGSEKIAVYKGGKAYGITVGKDGNLEVLDGAVVDGITVNSGAEYAQFHWGAKATNVNIAKGVSLGLKAGKGTYIQGTSAGKAFNITDGKISGYTLTGDSWLDVMAGGVAYNTILDGYEETELIVEDGGIAINTTVRNGHIEMEAGGTVDNTFIQNGDITISAGCVVRNDFKLGDNAYAETDDEGIFQEFTREFGIETRKVNADFFTDDLLTDELLIKQTEINITVSAKQSTGKYAILEDLGEFLAGKDIEISCGGKELGETFVGGAALNCNGYSYKAVIEGDDLYLKVTAPADSNLKKNNCSQIVGWDSEKGKVGFVANAGKTAPAWQGIWEWSGNDAAMWKVVGVGRFKGSTVDHDGILLYNGFGNTFAAWTNLNDPSYGYISLCHVEDNFATKTIANFDNNGFDDVIIYNGDGSFGIVLDAAEYKDIWHVEKNTKSTWQILGAGKFNERNGLDSLVVKNTVNNHLYLWENQDTSFATWNWSQSDIGKLENGWEFAATGDFEGDGIDDIIVKNNSTRDVWVWDDGKSSSARWRGTLGEGFEIEAAGDYNGDGKDDILLREHKSGWGGVGYWSAGYAGNWNDLNARIETDLESSFAVIA
ncbi:MAG: AIDA repeat-containing protein [Lentisphaeria bacterium]|nr:AIDA repeat-containing protein [Lentisphaeria bacterium]